MRRWFELGWNSDFANPLFFPTSNQSHQKGETPSAYDPVFISMPFKDDLVSILQGISLHDFNQPPNNFPYVILTARSGGSTAAPLTNANQGDSCQAEHVVNGTNTFGWSIEFTFTAGFWQMFLGGFPKPAGGFTPPLFGVSTIPPSEN